jgi:type II secretory pathway component PulK
MVLVLVLILLGLITGLVIQAQMVARMALRSEEVKASRSLLRAAATDAAWDALTTLAADKDLQVDHTNEPWAKPMERLLSNGIATSARVIDENRWFDVNSLSTRLDEKVKRQPVDVVGDLLALAQQGDPAVQALILKDWIDQDHAGLREADYYRSLNPPVTIADAFMESPQELAGVLALAGSGGKASAGLVALPDRAARIMPINLNTAGRDVIMAVLGPQNRSAADSLCKLRDATPLMSMAMLSRLLKTGTDNPWSRYFAVNSAFYTVTASATKDSGSVEVYALAARDAQGNVEILRWLCR